MPGSFDGFLTGGGQTTLGSYTTTEELDDTVLRIPISLMLVIGELERAISVSKFNDCILHNDLSRPAEPQHQSDRCHYSNRPRHSALKTHNRDEQFIGFLRITVHLSLDAHDTGISTPT
jgi:hypothetical protein